MKYNPRFAWVRAVAQENSRRCSRPVYRRQGSRWRLSAQRFGGRADIMAQLMPDGDCQHSGTYNGHPVMVAAALAAVRRIWCRVFTNSLFAIGDRLYSEINAIFSGTMFRAARLVWGTLWDLFWC